MKFHYQTRKATPDNTLIDDSRKCDRAMELVLGKQFKLEVWEVIVQKMALNEVAKFTVDKSLVQQYPFISKTIRDAHKKPEERKHCCGMTLQNEGLGYKELDDLFKNPCDLEFIIDLISVELPEDYERSSWQLNDEEKVDTVGELRERGNGKFKESKYEEAMQDYEQALGMLEQLMLKWVVYSLSITLSLIGCLTKEQFLIDREKPQDTEWLELFDKKKPVLLNYAQCKINVHEFYPAIEYCTEILKQDPGRLTSEILFLIWKLIQSLPLDNVKALFRRAKAHTGAWNLQEARNDFTRALELDNKLTTTVTKELKLIDGLEKSRDKEDKERFKNMFTWAGDRFHMCKWWAFLLLSPFLPLSDCTTTV